MPPISAAPTSAVSFKRRRRGGFSFVEAAIALVAAALFSGAILTAVSAQLLADAHQARSVEAVLWFETIFARHARGADPAETPPPAPGWLIESESSDDGEPPVVRYLFSPADRPSFIQRLDLFDRTASVASASESVENTTVRPTPSNASPTATEPMGMTPTR